MKKKMFMMVARGTGEVVVDVADYIWEGDA